MKALDGQYKEHYENVLNSMYAIWNIPNMKAVLSGFDFSPFEENVQVKDGNKESKQNIVQNEKMT